MAGESGKEGAAASLQVIRPLGDVYVLTNKLSNLRC